MNGARANLSIYPRLRSWGKRRAQQHRGAQAPSRGRTGQEVSVGARLPGGRGVTFRTSASKMPQRVWPFQVGSPENSRAGSRRQEAHSVAVQRNINTSCRIHR